MTSARPRETRDELPVLVLGGGVSGLAAAHRLAQGGARVALLEAGTRTGGIVATTVEGGAVLEHGPDGFITTKPWARDLALELGLGSQLMGTSPEHRRSCVVHGGRLVAVPTGFHLIAPSQLGPFLASPLVSWRGKLRALLDLSLPARRGGGDESLAHFVKRRLGPELFATLAEPLASGIYTADPDRLSLRATMPQFLEHEEKHGSVIRGLRAAQDHEAEKASGARYSLFQSFGRGQAVLTDAIAAALPPGTIRLGARVAAARRDGERFVVELASGETVRGSALVCALNAPVAARVLAPLDGELGRLLGTIAYASAATVNLLLRREDVRDPLDAMGFVVPSRERRFLMSTSFISTKYPGRIPEGHVLLRAFVGGARHPQQVELDDAAIVAGCLEDLDRLLGIRGAPVRTLVCRWRESMPQYLLGHLDRVAALEARADAQPGLWLAGNAYRGVGIPDCIRAGQGAARHALKWLSAKR